MSKRLRILFVAFSITALFFGVLAFAVAHSRILGNSGRDGSVRTLTTSTTQSGPIQNLRFTVFAAGLYPHQLRAKPGVVAIVLEDHTRRSPDIVIERETPGGYVRIGHTSFLPNQSRTRTELGLGVGRYRVSDATNLAYQADIIVEQ